MLSLNRDYRGETLGLRPESVIETRISAPPPPRASLRRRPRQRRHLPPLRLVGHQHRQQHLDHPAAGARAALAPADHDVGHQRQLAVFDRLGEAQQHGRIELVLRAAIGLHLLVGGFGLGEADGADFIGVGEADLLDARGLAFALEAGALGGLRGHDTQSPIANLATGGPQRVESCRASSRARRSDPVLRIAPVAWSGLLRVARNDRRATEIV